MISAASWQIEQGPVVAAPEQCERAANRVSDERIRAVYHDMARQWREMADQAEAINRLREARNQLLR